MGQQASSSGTAHWFLWMLGAALSAAVIVAALRFSEAQEIARLTERAQPWWLLAAMALQVGTYAAQGEIWRDIGRAAHSPLSLSYAFELSLAKLFVDQALPSAGVSGTVAVAKSLQDHGMARPAVMAGVVVNIASYFVVYVLSLGVAVLLLPPHGSTGSLVFLGAGLFVLCSIALVVVVLVLPGGANSAIGKPLARFRFLQRFLQYLEEADTTLARRPLLLLRSCAWQLTIVLLDAATVWILLVALGVTASVVAVFASFMISNLFRAIGILPGGLGTFEASSVLTLQAVGVPLPVALSTTLLFRGLSFWLPMLPGVWLSRRLLRVHSSASGNLVISGYWALQPEQVLQRLQATAEGLSATEATERLQRVGPNQLHEERPLSRLRVLGRQVANPLLLLLVFAAGVAAATGEWANASIVVSIVLASVVIGYRREHSAHAAAAKLRSRVRTRAKVQRDGSECSVLLEDIVPGDVVLLCAGNLVPADALILEATDCYVSESVLTGESFPTEKRPGVVAADAALADRKSVV